MKFNPEKEAPFAFGKLVLVLVIGIGLSGLLLRNRPIMPLKFTPNQGTVLVCDFSGFEPPEMNKKRPVVVVAPRLPYRDELATVVPLSTTAPRHAHPFCVKLERNYTPWGDPDDDSWAKADMILSVSVARLNGFKIGKRKWLLPEVSAADLLRIKQGVIHSIGMGHLLIRPEGAI